MFNFALMNKFLSMYGMEEPQIFGVMKCCDNFPPYININAALLDALSASTADDDFLSIVLALILHYDKLDTSEVSKDTLVSIVKTLAERAISSDSVLFYIVLFAYTCDTDVLNVIVTYSNVSFYEAACMLIITDFLTGGIKEKYVRHVESCIEESLITEPVHADVVANHLGLIYERVKDGTLKSVVCKQLCKLFTAVPPANSALLRTNVELCDLLYISLHLAATNTYSELSNKVNRMKFKFVEACVRSKKLLTTCVKDMFASCISYVTLNSCSSPYYGYDITNYYRSNGIVSTVDDNYLWMINEVTKSRNNHTAYFLYYDVFDTKYYARTMQLAQVHPDVVLHMIDSDIQKVTTESIRALLSDNDLLLNIIFTGNAHIASKVFKALVYNEMYTPQQLFERMSSEVMVDVVAMCKDVKHLEVLLNMSVSDSVLSAAVQKFQVRTLLSSNLFSIGEYMKLTLHRSLCNIFCFTEYVRVLNNAMLQDISSFELERSELRKYAESYIAFEKASNRNVENDEVYRCLYSADEFDAYIQRKYAEVSCRISAEIDSSEDIYDIVRVITKALKCYTAEYIIPILNNLVLRVVMGPQDVNDCLHLLYKLRGIAQCEALNYAEFLHIITQRMEVEKC